MWTVLKKPPTWSTRVNHRQYYTTVFLYESEDDARNGTNCGGTGFALGVICEPDLEDDPRTRPTRRTYLVTNAHIAYAHHWVRYIAQSVDAVFEVAGDRWHFHPEGHHIDVAVAILRPAGGPDKPWDYRSDAWIHPFPGELLVTPKRARANDLGPGDECFMVGRLSSVITGDRMLPIDRFGVYISHGCRETPISSGPPFNSRQPSVLLEMRSLGGYSGSPVYILRNPGFFEEHHAIPGLAGKRIEGERQLDHYPQSLLLGVCWGHIENKVDVVVDEGGKRKVVGSALQNSGIAAVIGAWRLQELIDMVEKDIDDADRFAQRGRHAPWAAAIREVQRARRQSRTPAPE